jgi:hypothetical protein
MIIPTNFYSTRRTDLFVHRNGPDLGETLFWPHIFTQLGSFVFYDKFYDKNGIAG